MTEIDHEPWAQAMSEFLLVAKALVGQAAQRGEAGLAAGVLAELGQGHDEIVAAGLAFHQQQAPLVRQTGARGKPPRRPGHNLLIRLCSFKQDVLRFAANFEVPFTNNQAERDIRMMNVKMKISGGFRTMLGAETFATLRSVLATARKQARNILDALTLPAHALADILHA